MSRSKKQMMKTQMNQYLLIILVCMVLSIMIFTMTSQNSTQSISSIISTTVKPRDLMTSPTRRKTDEIEFPSSSLKMEPPSKDCFSKIKKLKSVVLAVNYNWPHYKSTSLLRSFYEPIFGKVMFCGDRNDTSENLYRVPLIVGRKGFQAYMCLNFAMQLYPDFEGYFQTNDDIIINWWQILRMDIKKIWLWRFTPWEYENYYIFGQKAKETWSWWRAVDADIKCERAFQATENFANSTKGRALGMGNYLKNFFNISKGNKMCFVSWSDIFYIPKQLKDAYVAISDIWGNNNAFLETAVPSILAFLMDNNVRNYEYFNGQFIGRYPGEPGFESYQKGILFHELYNFKTQFVHPIKFEKPPMGKANINFFNSIVRAYSELVYQFCEVIADGK